MSSSLLSSSSSQPPQQQQSIQQQNRISIRRKPISSSSSSSSSQPPPPQQNGYSSIIIPWRYLNGGSGSTTRHHRSSLTSKVFAVNRTTNNNTNTKRIPQQCIILCCITIFCFQCITLIPILLYENQKQSSISSSSSSTTSSSSISSSISLIQRPTKTSLKQYPTRITKDNRIVPIFTIQDIKSNIVYNEEIITPTLPLLRGIQNDIYHHHNNNNNNIPDALIGAKRGTITCPQLNVNSLAYWNQPIGIRDIQYKSPFSIYNHHHHHHDKPSNNDNDEQKEEMYISFAPDPGGWNNIRMSMEIIFVIAATTRRTLILPPKEPMYLLQNDHHQKYRGFIDFFPIYTREFQKMVKTITFEEFLIKEGQNGPLSVNTLRQKQQQQQYPFNVTTTTTTNIEIPTYEQLLQVANHCDKRKVLSTTNCVHVYNYLSLIGYTPDISASRSCLIFDELVYNNATVELSIDVQDYISTVCGTKRTPVYFNHHEQQLHRVLHFQADQNQYRLLTHYYNMIHYTNPILSNYYKRFVRNYLHYFDDIYCAAGIIIKTIQYESAIRTPSYLPDMYGAGGYSAMHVRRGDLQYKKVKISAAEWYNNTKEVWLPNEILYIATDEKNKSFFADLGKYHTLRYLDDYWDIAGLGNLDPNYMGMIDTIVASRGRAFAGTWFSTFSGYINRLRGYHGMSMNQSWYSFLDRKTALHTWNIVNDFVYAYEYPDGWIGIDTNTYPTRDQF